VGSFVAALSAEPMDQGAPKAFVDSIYNTYLAKDSKGVSIDNEAAIRRYFAPPLSDAIVKDMAEAQKANEVPTLNGDPFIDAQDWEIANLRTVVKTTGANTAVATVNFTIFRKPRTVTLDLIRTGDGWRIAKIRAPSGSLRALYKLK
jgi:hypothetical protein